ncbi:MAG: ComF family protein [Bacillota bacterium]
MGMGDLARTIKEWLYPPLPRCIWCGNEHWPDGRIPFCPACMEQVPLITGPRCAKCGKPLRLGSQDQPYCYLCRTERYFFGKVRCAAVYDGIIKQLLYRLKYYGESYLGEKLGDLLAERIKGDWGCYFYDLIVPIPISAGKIAERGYNQAALLASGVAEFLRKPLAGEALIRHKETLSQNELSLPERKKNLQDAFLTAKPAQVAGRRILLVDDIFTTGATLSYAARELLKSGAGSVDALVLAAGVVPEQW